MIDKGTRRGIESESEFDDDESPNKVAGDGMSGRQEATRNL
jgi:hypothetical protein